MRVDLGIDQRNQGVDDHSPNAREATAQTVDLEHHDQTHQIITDRLTDTGRMRQHQRTLQVFQVFAGNPRRSEQAEAGVDAVGGAVLGQNAFDTGDAVVDLTVCAAVQRQADRLQINAAQLRQGQLAGDQVQRLGR